MHWDLSPDKIEGKKNSDLCLSRVTILHFEIIVHLVRLDLNPNRVVPNNLWIQARLEARSWQFSKMSPFAGTRHT